MNEASFQHFERKINKSLESPNLLQIEFVDNDAIRKFYRSRKEEEYSQIPPEIWKIIENGEQLIHSPYEPGVSLVNEKPKFTTKMYDCTGVVITGKDWVTNKNISFISHTSRPAYLSLTNFDWKLHNTARQLSEMNEYEQELEERMKVIKDRCIPESIDAVIIGGIVTKTRYNHSRKAEVDSPEETIAFEQDNYDRSVSSLKSVVASSLGIEPRLVHDPSTRRLEDSSTEGGKRLFS